MHAGAAAHDRAGRPRSVQREVICRLGMVARNQLAAHSHHVQALLAISWPHQLQYHVKSGVRIRLGAAAAGGKWWYCTMCVGMAREA